MEDSFIQAIYLQMNSLNNNKHSWIIQTFVIILFRDKM